VRIRSCRGSLPQDLLSDASIDSLAEQVGVAVVAGILLDHVDQEFAQGDRPPGPVMSDEAEIGVVHELLGEGDLLAPCSPCFRHDRGIGHGTVGLGVGL